jgi:hypothetical protein
MKGLRLPAPARHPGRRELARAWGWGWGARPNVSHRARSVNALAGVALVSGREFMHHQLPAFRSCRPSVTALRPAIEVSP